jgi:hypothetical protein
VFVEYAAVVSAFGLLAATLGGAYGENVARVFASSKVGSAAVGKAARSEGVSTSGARAAYKRAPYSKPGLKYLYAMGWIGGKKHPGQCKLISVTQETTRKQVEKEIRRTPKLLAQLKKRSISAAQGAAALVKGVVSACT